MARNVIAVDFQLNKCKCGMNHQHVAMLEQSIGSGKDKNVVTMACLRLNWSWAGYQKSLKKDAHRAIKKVKAFPVEVFDPYQESGFGRIIQSRSFVRSAGLDVDSHIHGNYPSDDCNWHWRKWYGVFEPPCKDFPRQRLLAFVNVSRLGNFVTYAYPNAYSEYMPLGIMTRLHLGVVERLLDKTDDDHRGLEFLIYDEFFNSKKGLLNWKKKMLFGPKKLKLVKRQDYGVCYEQL